ncbi:MAG: RIP metalloprotease RseP [Planctomycetota bacterium]
MLEFLIAILGISFLIFVHELGHFLAAKHVGIRVDTFALGFQPTIFGFRARFCAFKWGDTEYVIGMLPFGGYVKMAGEELGDEKTGSGDEFASKSIAQRAYVLVAGATMNIIFGFLFFILAYTVGVKFQSTAIGGVAPFGPAWEAGLMSGDRILQIDGKDRTDYTEVNTTVALSGLERALAVTVERNSQGRKQILTRQIRPAYDSNLGMPTIEISPALRMEVRLVVPDSPAQQAGLQKGDRIEQVTLVAEDTRLTIPGGASAWRTSRILGDFLRDHGEGSLLLEVSNDIEEKAEKRLVSIPLRPSGDNEGFTRLRTGLLERRRVIAGVQPRSEAADIFQAGWEILSLNGQPIEVLDAWSITKAAQGSDTLTFQTRSGESGTVSRDSLLLWTDSQLVVGTGKTAIGEVLPNSPAASLGLESGDRLLGVNGKPFTNRLTVSFLKDAPEGASGIHQVSWWDGKERHTAKVDLPAGGDPGVRFVTRVVVGRVPEGSPAARGGLLPGDEVFKVNGEDIETFSDLVNAATFDRSRASENLQLNFEVLRDGAMTHLTVEPRPFGGYHGFALARDQYVQTASIGEALILGPRKGVLWAKNIFLTLRALAKRDVAAKNLAGPVGIIDIGRRTLSMGFGRFLFIVALISINLGILNLFPFPILDGGHLLFLSIEKIKGSPVSEKIQYAFHMVAFAMLIGLAVFVTYNDIARWF